MTFEIGKPGRLPGDPRCPFCGAHSDGFTAVSDAEAKPSPGDVSVCLYCCEFGVYDGDPITVRRPTAEEAAEFAADPEMVETRELTRRARSLGGFQERSRLQ